MSINKVIFHDEAAARAHIEASRWPDGKPVCPFCESTRVRRMGGRTQAGMFLCNACRQKFTVRTGTIMARSHIALHQWLAAIHLMTAANERITAKQMEHVLGVTYKTAWFVHRRIREAMRRPLGDGHLAGPILMEADETIVSGKSRNDASRTCKPEKADPALVSRETRVRSFHIADIFAHADSGAHLVTDSNHSAKSSLLRRTLVLYLKGEHPGQRDAGDQGARCPIHLMDELHMSESELLQAAFDSKHIDTVRSNKGEGIAKHLLLKYV
jgi:transposase-like protein